MAIEFDFEKTHLGIPFQKCYARIENLQNDFLRKTTDVWVSVYPSAEIRQNNIYEKRHAIQKRLDDLKTQPQLNWEQIQDTERELEKASGGMPFYVQKFTFEGVLSIDQAYEKLHSVDYVGNEDGKEIKYDFTKGVMV